MPEQFFVAGDDPTIPADILAPSADPNYFPSPADPGYLDPLNNVTALDSSTVVVGPGSLVDSADAVSPTVNSPSGSSIWDSIFKVAALGTSIASAYTFRTGTISNPTVPAAKAAQAKTTAGTSPSLLIFAVVGFLALIALFAFRD